MNRPQTIPALTRAALAFHASRFGARRPAADPPPAGAPPNRAARRAARAARRRTYAARLLSAWSANPRAGRTLHGPTLRAVARRRAFASAARRAVAAARGGAL
jgi:hypothetical protein